MNITTIIVSIVLVILMVLVIFGITIAIQEGDQYEEENKNNHNDRANH